jgi:hypothetical protein
MIERSIFIELNAKYGPFTVDACSDSMGFNSHVSNKFFTPDKSFLNSTAADFNNDIIWMNPPYSDPEPFLSHYLGLKASNPALGMVVVLPRWRSKPWRHLTTHFKLVKTYPRGTQLFTRPRVQGQPERETVGPIRWPVQVWYDPPSRRFTPVNAKPLFAKLPEASVSPPPPPTSTKPMPEPIPIDIGEPPLSIVNLTDHRLQDQLVIFAGEVEGEPVSVLLDSGASRNFISRDFAQQACITLRQGDRLRVRQANGQISSTDEHADIVLRISDVTFNESFVVTDLGIRANGNSYDLILGKPWLTHHNPQIDWTSNTANIQGKVISGITHQRPASVSVLNATKMAKQLRKHGTTAFIALVTAAPPDSAATAKPTLEEQLTNVSTDQSAEWTARLRTLLQGHRITFMEPDSLPPERPGLDHTIDLLPESSPPPQRTYRMSPAELQEVQRQLETYLAKGWVRPSSSPFGAPILFARKKDGTLRMCVDYRALNAITVKDKYPLPRIDELFDVMRGATIFTSLDLAQGYHQVRIQEQHIHRTAFRTRFGLYEFTVLPFGLTNAPPTFMRLMHSILGPYLDKFVVVFLDDICIFSSNAEDHLHHIDTVLKTLAAHNLKVKLSKCSFGRQELEFLGHLISRQGVRPDPRKLQAVRDWPIPKDTTEVRQFLGFTNFYRKFVKDFSTIAAPLTDLTKSTVPFRWDVDTQSSFDALKNALCSAPVLVLPHTGPDATFTLYTDASTFAVGAVLLQEHNSALHPVAFESRKLNPHERNYPVHELELLAVVHGLRTFRHYLEGCKRFNTVTDHDTLRHFFGQKDLSRRQARWLEFLAPYANSMDIVYRRGTENQADALSRRPDLKSELERLHLAMPASADLHLLTTLGFDSEFRDAIRRGYALDPLYSAEHDKARPKFLKKTADGFWHFGERLAVPNVPDLRLKLLYECHDAATAGHQGYHRTLASIAQSYWWPHMSRTVRAYCTACATCQRTKPSTDRPPGLLQPLPVPPRPWSHVSLDLITDLPESQGFDSIAVFVDTYTKMAHFAPTKKTVTAPELARLFMDTVVKLHGLPRVLISDRDPRFTSDFWTSTFALLRTRLNISTSYHPQTDGQTERTNRTLEQILRAYCHPLHDDWAAFLSTAEFAFNAHVNASTGVSPFYATYGYNPDTPATLDTAVPIDDPSALTHLERVKAVHALITENLKTAKARQAEFADRHRRELTFAVGDSVKLDTEKLMLHGQPSAKFKDRFVGPFKVTEVVNPVAYRLALPSSMSRVHPVFHVSRLLPWRVNAELPDQPQPDRPVPAAADFVSGDDVYEVDSILDCRVAPSRSTVQFLVRWTGYADPTWEPFSHVKRTDALRAFLLSSRWNAFAGSSAYVSLPRRVQESLAAVVSAS